MKFIKSSAPHIWKKGSKDQIMGLVILALLPATFTGAYIFGQQALLIIITGLITAWVTDIAMQFLTKNRGSIINLSSILTGLLLALVLPPTAPLWMPAVGTIIAVSIGKYAFGPGNSIFNPALVGRAFLVLSWPQLMSTWVAPDGVTKATPLAANVKPLYTELFFGSVGGCIGETSAIALLLGGVFLIVFRVIDWRIPFTYIATVGVLTSITGSDPLFHILAGGLIIGAFFMATDYVTIPITGNGRLIFAVGCGLLTFLFRIYSGMPEGVMYSILLMNALTPLIEKLTVPKPFGGKR
ncbi:MAG: RnfABCDGE type electron transport complex subunit D [Nanoarchaeota archaeon]